MYPRCASLSGKATINLLFCCMLCMYLPYIVYWFHFRYSCLYVAYVYLGCEKFNFSCDACAVIILPLALIAEVIVLMCSDHFNKSISTQASRVHWKSESMCTLYLVPCPVKPFCCCMFPIALHVICSEVGLVAVQLFLSLPRTCRLTIYVPDIVQCILQIV